MLSKLAIWYLRKIKISVLIGFELKYGDLKSLNPKTRTYDNSLYNVEYRTCDGNRLFLPEGKFSITRKSK